MAYDGKRKKREENSPRGNYLGGARFSVVSVAVVTTTVALCRLRRGFFCVSCIVFVFFRHSDFCCACLFVCDISDFVSSTIKTIQDNMSELSNLQALVGLQLQRFHE